MNTRQRLYKIDDLALGKRLQLMTDTQVDLYVELLNAFVETFPAEEANLKAEMEKRDIDAVIRSLSRFRDTLASIHADNLADECWARISSFDKDRPEKIEAYVLFFLSNLAALSIDIQVAFLIDEEDGDTRIVGAVPETKKGETKSILAVDDDTFFLDTFKAALKDVPCKIIGVTSGLSALGALKSLSPDLFALDIEMPGMDGIELAGEIKALGHKAPIVFITGNATRAYVSKCINAGAADFIIKPINPANAASRITKLLG